MCLGEAACIFHQCSEPGKSHDKDTYGLGSLVTIVKGKEGSERVVASSWALWVPLVIMGMQVNSMKLLHVLVGRVMSAHLLPRTNRPIRQVSACGILSPRRRLLVAFISFLDELSGGNCPQPKLQV